MGHKNNSKEIIAIPRYLCSRYIAWVWDWVVAVQVGCLGGPKTGNALLHGIQIVSLRYARLIEFNAIQQVSCDFDVRLIFSSVRVRARKAK